MATMIPANVERFTVDNHSLKYFDFEGIIPEGQYGYACLLPGVSGMVISISPFFSAG